MDALFLKIFNLSIIAGWITLAIVVLRPLLKKAPKALTVALWALVAIRLLVPLSVESEISVIPSTQIVPPEIVYVEEPQIHSGIQVANTLINPVIAETMAPKPEASVNPMQIAVTVASTVWVVGMIAMAVYALLSYLRIRLKVRASIPLQKRVRICDNINSPFILGVFRPRIYLPSNLTEEQKKHVIAHEEAHLKRKDHWWKPLGFALLTVYWFHPLLWVAYILLCRDIELACDEKVIKHMETDEKTSYSESLLACSMPRRMIAACPLAFGEVGVKKRIKEILHYKKPALWLTILAIVICVVCTGCLLTNPLEKTQESTQAPIYDTSPNSDYSLGKKIYCDDSVKNTNIVFPAYYDLENDQLCITTQTQKNPVGQLKAFELTEENFDNLFVSQNWYFGDSTQKIRENNETAWQIFSQEDPQTPTKYLLKQKNSDVLLLVYLMEITKDDEKVLIAEHVYQLVPNVEGQPSVYEQIILEFFNDPSSNLGMIFFNDGGSPYSGYSLYIFNDGNCQLSIENPPHSSTLGPAIRFNYIQEQEKILMFYEGIHICTLTQKGDTFVFSKSQLAPDEIKGTLGKLTLPADGTVFFLRQYS